MFRKVELSKMLLPLIYLIGLLASVECDKFKFPKDFLFGVATASYQVEGGWNSDGKGENIWDRLTHEHPDWVKDNTNGDVACDSYNNYKADVAAIKALGANFYRFSLSWPRIFPTGLSNRVNQNGIRYYNNLINELLSNNIRPIVTLYHWDLPQTLQDLGGWTNEILAAYFEDYADAAFRLFGDRVKTWITFNEPNDVCESAYGDGDDAPAYNYSGTADYLCGRTLILAHAKAYRLYERVYKNTQKGMVGITVNSIWPEPKTNSSVDVEAAEKYMQMNYGWWIHPILSREGDYPELMKKRISKLSSIENYPRSRLPPFSKFQIQYIKGTFDFLGFNHYSTWLVSDDEQPINNPPSHSKDVGVKLEQDPKWKPSALHWLKVVPWGFRKILNWIKHEYGNPLVYVTENGFADLEGLNDTGRIYYHREYLKALLEAIHLDGCNVKAYTVWSLMDNMEWREGYTVKFGLYHVDFNDPQRKRTPKLSAKFYRNVIKTRMV